MPFPIQAVTLATAVILHREISTCCSRESSPQASFEILSHSQGPEQESSSQDYSRFIPRPPVLCERILNSDCFSTVVNLYVCFKALWVLILPHHALLLVSSKLKHSKPSKACILWPDRDPFGVIIPDCYLPV